MALGLIWNMVVATTATWGNSTKTLAETMADMANLLM
jgi:hypothetical protein